MARKSCLLLLFFLLSLVPPAQVQAQSSDLKSLDDSVNFLYISDAILTPEDELDLTSKPAGVGAPIMNDPQQERVNINPLLARIIHAKKMQRNDLDANCKLLVQQLRGQGKDCEAQKVQNYCDHKRAEINTLIGYYHKKRGDRRKFFTRIWHSIKRSSENFWHKIGPVGRNFLRHMGDEALQTVVSGGTLSGGTLRTLIKNYIKTQARNRVKQIVYQGVERLLMGQISIAKSAGVDICSDESETEQDDKKEEKSWTSSVLDLSLPLSEIDLSWQALYQPDDQFHVCGGMEPGAPEQELPLNSFQLTIDPEAHLLVANLSGSQTITNPPEQLGAEINQQYSIDIGSEYQVEDVGHQQYYDFTGKAKVNLSSSGKVECSYWTVPETGDPIYNTYWVQNSASRNDTVPVVVHLYTPDGTTGTLYLDLFTGNWDFNSYFTLRTQKINLTEEQIQTLLAY
jgi:hypothetical protein